MSKKLYVVATLFLLFLMVAFWTGESVFADEPQEAQSAGTTLYFPIIFKSKPFYEVKQFWNDVHTQYGKTKGEAFYPPTNPYWYDKKPPIQPMLAWIKTYDDISNVYWLTRTFLELDVPDLTFDPQKIVIKCTDFVHQSTHIEPSVVSIHKGTWEGSIMDHAYERDGVKYYWDEWDRKAIDQFDVPATDFSYELETEITIKNTTGQKLIDPDGKIRLLFRHGDELTWKAEENQYQEVDDFCTPVVIRLYP